MSDTKNVLLQGLKTGVLALVFSCIGVLVLALVAQITGLSDKSLPIINQVLKIVAVALAVLIATKEQKFFAKGVVGAIVFCLLSLLVFQLMGGAFSFAQVALDLAIALVVAVVVSFLKARKA